MAMNHTSHPIDTLPELIRKRESWRGTAAELLALVNQDEITRNEAWPKTPWTLSKILRRNASRLRHHGVAVQFLRQVHLNRRVLSLEWVGV